MSLNKRAVELLQQAQQRAADFLLECRIRYHCRMILECWHDQQLRAEHHACMKDLIRKRSPGQIARMERRLGLRT